MRLQFIRVNRVDRVTLRTTLQKMRHMLISTLRAHCCTDLMCFTATIGLGDGLLKRDRLAIDVGNFDLGLVTPVGLGCRYAFAPAFFLR